MGCLLKMFYHHIILAVNSGEMKERQHNREKHEGRSKYKEALEYNPTAKVMGRSLQHLSTDEHNEQQQGNQQHSEGCHNKIAPSQLRCTQKGHITNQDKGQKAKDMTP